MTPLNRNSLTVRKDLLSHPFSRLSPAHMRLLYRLMGSRSTNNTQKDEETRASGGVGRAATDKSSFETSIARLNCQQHIEELEKRRMILLSLKRENGRAKADYAKSMNTVQCLRRQGQHDFRFWRKQKKSAERSLGKTARKLRIARILNGEMTIKVWTKQQR